jgi:Tol biopolymer transport system component
VALAGAFVLCAGLFFSLSRRHATRAALTEVPLTSYQGYQGEPTLSPDGSQFAFIWDGGQENAPPQLYVSLTGQGTPLRLTNSAITEARYPAWSPDGQTIAFFHRPFGRGPGSLVLIPALGGAERKIDEANVLGPGGNLRSGRPAWSPDGKWLFFSREISSESYALFVVPSAGGEKRQLIDPPGGTYGDSYPSLSLDGSRLAFVRSFGDYDQDLFVADLRDSNTAGTPQRLTNNRGSKYAPTWTTGGDIIYIAGEYTSLQGIYRVTGSGGKPVRLEGIGDYAQDLAIASKGHRLVYSRSYRDYNIWRMPLSVGGNSAGPPAKFLASTRYETSPAYSPDGKRIAFSSNRGGVRQIWVADADGSNPVALTDFVAGVAGSPKWSPDGQTIVFDARPEGRADIYSVKSDGGPPKRLTDNPAEDHVPSYSADGRWIYFASTRSGESQLYRMLSTGGEAVQITHNGGLASVASRDGRWLYYSKADRSVWKMPVDGSKETMLLRAGSLFHYFTFCVTASGVYFASAPDPATRTIPLKLYRLADATIVQLGHFDKPLNLFLSVSPDEKWLLYTQLDSSVDDLIMIENFR